MKKTIQKFAWGYAVIFFLVVAAGYVPGLTDAQGKLCGLFKIEWWDDALHLGSMLWAALAGWRSEQASLFYFRAFGLVYFLDGVVGTIFGQAYLDLGIFIYGPYGYNVIENLPANLPHLFIGGLALLIGFVIGPRLMARAAARDATQDAGNANLRSVVS